LSIPVVYYLFLYLIMHRENFLTDRQYFFSVFQLGY